MRPQNCTAPRSEHGDCWRACIATVTGIAAETLPNFAHEHSDDWKARYRLVRDHLRPLGLNIFTTYCSAKWEVDRLLEVFSADNTDVPVIVAGRSRDGSADHAVVVMNGKIVHDPSGAGMVAPCACSCSDPSCEVERWYWIDVICVDSSWTERRPG